MPLRPLFINGRFLTQTITGTQRYGREILKRLDAMLADPLAGWPEIELLVPKTQEKLPEYKHLKVRTVGVSTGQAWAQFELPIYARRGYLFTPCGGAPVMHPRNIVTLHDAAVFARPQGYSLRYRAWCRWLYPRLCRSARHVFTVSQFSKSELVKYCDADPARISVTYLGSEHATAVVAEPRILDEYGVRPSEYVFTVSSRAPNKNSDALFAAFPFFSRLQLDLVVAGATNKSIFPPAGDLPSDAVDVGYVTDPELRALYENAACFVFLLSMRGLVYRLSRRWLWAVRSWFRGRAHSPRYLAQLRSFAIRTMRATLQPKSLKPARPPGNTGSDAGSSRRSFSGRGVRG